ncbi:unnamed protein product [Clonostachys byssicola]|uniref:Uncharacterized protein n=1 Tax=Clonostachys byssicola TaxID=160290 RepID=A0A9N9UTS1_9HYPO|nr:unnamed protein product [Clonostachys byssicola]
MSSEKLEEKLDKMSKLLATLTDQNKECKEALEKCLEMSNKSLDEKLVKLKGNNERTKEQMKMLFGEEKNVEEQFMPYAWSKCLQDEEIHLRDKERGEFGVKVNELDRAMRKSDDLIKSIEEASRKKSAGSEAE